MFYKIQGIFQMVALFQLVAEDKVLIFQLFLSNLCQNVCFVKIFNLRCMFYFVSFLLKVFCLFIHLL